MAMRTSLRFVPLASLPGRSALRLGTSGCRDHLESCEFCRQELERLATASQLWGDARLLGGEAEPGASPTIGLAHGTLEANVVTRQVVHASPAARAGQRGGLLAGGKLWPSARATGEPRIPATSRHWPSRLMANDWPSPMRPRTAGGAVAVAILGVLTRPGGSLSCPTARRPWASLPMAGSWPPASGTARSASGMPPRWLPSFPVPSPPTAT